MVTFLRVVKEIAFMIELNLFENVENNFLVPYFRAGKARVFFKYGTTPGLYFFLSNAGYRKRVFIQKNA